MKSLKILLIALFSLTLCQGEGVQLTQCDQSNDNPIIRTSSTLLADASPINSWEKLVLDCIPDLSSNYMMESLTIIIDSDLSDEVDSNFSVSNSEIPSGIQLNVTIQEESNLDRQNMNYLFYDVLKVHATQEGEKELVTTINSEILLGPGSVTTLKELVESGDITTSSTVNLGGSELFTTSSKEAIEQYLQGPLNVDETGVDDCEDVILLYDELVLQSTDPELMLECLEKIDTNDGLVTKLTVDMSNSSFAPRADEVDFEEIFTNISDNIVEMNVNLSGSNCEQVINVFEIDNLYVDYSNNGYDDNFSKGLLFQLTILTFNVKNSLTIVFSQNGDTSVNELENAQNFDLLFDIIVRQNRNLAQQQLTTTLKVFDGTQNCDITSTDVNQNCDFLVVQPTVSDEIAYQCEGSTISFDSDLPDGYDGSELLWSLGNGGMIDEWFITLSETEDKKTDLTFAEAQKKQYSMEVSGPVTRNDVVVPVLYEPVEFVITDCVPKTTFMVGQEDLLSSYKICTSQIQDFEIGLNPTLQQNEDNVEIDESTGFQWQIQKLGNDNNFTDVDIEGGLTNSTLSILGSELNFGTFLVKVTIIEPQIIVDDFTFEIENCDAISQFQINEAQIEQTYDNCNDIVITVQDVQEAIVDQQTVYSWDLVSGGESKSGSLVVNEESFTVPKTSLVAGTYTISVDISQPLITIQDVEITITECTTNGNNNNNNNDDDDNNTQDDDDDNDENDDDDNNNDDDGEDGESNPNDNFSVILNFSYLFLAFIWII